MAGMSYPPFAFIYPNLSSPIPIEIFGLRINATHDLDARCFDNRSFLDFALWKYLKEGISQLEEVVGPHPPCKKIHGTKADEGNIVVGMLKNIIKVTILNVNKESKDKTVGEEGTEILLRNVLLVENLPVPMHIGTKQESDIYRAVFDCYHSILKQLKGKHARLNLTKDQFPERYREHPYWTSDTIIMPPYCDPRLVKRNITTKIGLF